MSYDPGKDIRSYLQGLDSALKDLPRGRRHEVVDEIASHIAEERSAEPIETQAQLLSMLERIGEPGEIAADARDRLGLGTAKSSWHEVFALILLLVGGFVFVFGWFAGLVLLWTSALWSTRDKLIGTFLFPFGLAFPVGVLLVVMTESLRPCSSGALSDAQGNPISSGSDCGGHAASAFVWVPAVILVIAFLLIPVGTTIYLARRMNRRKVTLSLADA
jgi:hypothetical protein